TDPPPDTTLTYTFWMPGSPPSAAPFRLSSRHTLPFTYPGGVVVSAKGTMTESPAAMVPEYGLLVMQVKLSGTVSVAVKAPVLTNWRATPAASVTATGVPPLTVT